MPSLPPSFLPSFLPQTWHMEVPELGVKSDLQLWSIPQPWQHWIWATPVITASCGSSRSLIHRAPRPGIKPHPHGWYVGFLTHRSTTVTSLFLIFICPTSFAFLYSLILAFLCLDIFYYALPISFFLLLFLVTFLALSLALQLAS